MVIVSAVGPENYNHSTPIIFFGTDEFSLVVLKNLFENEYNIAAIVTKPDGKSGRGNKIEMPTVKKFAIEKNIDVWQPNQVSEINEDLKKIYENAIGIVVSYGKIIPKSTIDSFGLGIINVHPSLLPKYRGPSPIESAILNGDDKTGVTIIKLTPQMDAGPIYGQIVYKLSGNETRLVLRRTLAKYGAETLLSLLPGVIDGSIQPKPQNEKNAIYCQLISKNESNLNPEITAVQAERQVRAYQGFPKTKIEINNHKIIIIQSHISNEHKTPLDIKFKDGKYLSIDELVAPSGKTISASEFINGYLD
jgi:methionyl-tRNA formyltransferase